MRREEKLYDAITGIEDTYVAEAEGYKGKKGRNGRKWMAAALWV